MTPTRLSHILAGGAPRTLAGEVYERMKGDILTCRLTPGQMIYESELVERYQVSRTPVREALSKLYQEGLVLAIPSVGHQVAPVSLDATREFVEMRTILEWAAIERAAERMTPEQAADLEALANQDQESNVSPRMLHEHTAREWYAMNTAFHVKLAECSGNRLLVQSTRRLLESAVRYYFLTVGTAMELPPLVHHHRELVTALRAGEIEKAKQVAQTDILSTLSDDSIDPNDPRVGGTGAELDA